ncbi:hypothetical protein [Nonomuraea sp. NPDC002799]
MSLSDVIRNIAKTVTNKDEMKEKAKDLPLFVIQTTLNAAGQALLVVDRVKNSIKGMGTKEEREEDYDSRPSAADQVAVPPAAEKKDEEEKPARKEPVIFAPRPGTAEPNGVAKSKPDPVIFTPASKTDSATAATTTTEPEAPAAVEPETKPAAQKPATAGPSAAEPTVVEPKATQPVAAEPVVAESKAAEPVVAEPVVVEPEATAEPKAVPKAAPKARAKAAPKKTAKATAEPVVAEKPVAAPKADEPAVAKEPVAAPEPEPAPEPVKAPEPKAAPEPVASTPVNLIEPLPGYSQLTVASLRARMRGKTAEQITDFLAYERTTTDRAEVIRMFENRLAKLQAGE